MELHTGKPKGYKIIFEKTGETFALNNNGITWEAQFETTNDAMGFAMFLNSGLKMNQFIIVPSFK